MNWRVGICQVTGRNGPGKYSVHLRIMWNGSIIWTGRHHATVGQGLSATGWKAAYLSRRHMICLFVPGWQNCLSKKGCPVPNVPVFWLGVQEGDRQMRVGLSAHVLVSGRIRCLTPSGRKDYPA